MFSFFQQLADLPSSVTERAKSILLERVSEGLQQEGVQREGVRLLEALPEAVHQEGARLLESLPEAVHQEGARLLEAVPVVVEGASSTVIGLAVGLGLSAVVILGFVGFGYLLYRVSG